MKNSNKKYYYKARQKAKKHRKMIAIARNVCELLAALQQAVKRNQYSMPILEEGGIINEQKKEKNGRFSQNVFT